jgi:RimJ/RimL family protein N-acetyltransferase
VAACRDPEIPRWTGVPSPYTEEDARTFLAQTEESAFAITDRESGELLGAIGLREVDQQNAQIGYWVKREARGRGVATRALRLVSRYAINDLGAGRVQLFTEPENVPSQRVAEKAGFVREGVLRRYLNMKGTRRDGVVFSLLPGDL